MTELLAGEGRGLWSDARRRLGCNRLALTALAVIVLLACLAALAPLLSPWAYDSLDWRHLAAPPGTHGVALAGHRPPGTRPVACARSTARGCRSLISLVASAVSLAIGIAWGSIAGYAGGRTDAWMMRCVDVLYSLPYLFIVIILTTLFRRGSIAVLLLGVAAVGWLTTARIVRGQTLALKRREFIEAARATGATPCGRSCGGTSCRICSGPWRCTRRSPSHR